MARIAPAACVLVLSVVPLAPASAAGTITVGPAGADFADIPPAIEAASPGDAILVAPGTYSAFTLSKAVHVLGAGSDLVTVVPAGPFAPGVRVTGLAPGDDVVVSGLRAGFVGIAPVFEVVDTEGSVTLHDVAIDDHVEVGILVRDAGRVLVLASRLDGVGLVLGGSDAAVIVERAEAWLVDTSVKGTDGWQTSDAVALPGARAVRVTEGLLHVARSRLEGGDAYPASGNGTPFGGDALQVERSTVLVVGGGEAALVGGDGGTSTNDGIDWPGGHGLELLGGAVGVVGAEVPLAGGLDGSGLVVAAGLFADAASSSLVDPVLRPTLAVDALRASPGDAVTLSVEGEPGTAWLFASLAAGPTTGVPGLAGAALLDLGALVPLGSGGPVLPVAVPPLAGLAGTAPVLQAVAPAGGALSATNPVRLPLVP